MPSTGKVLDRLHQQVDDLSRSFEECLDFFDKESPFVGPSSYFHLKTLAARSSHGSIASLVQDELFFDWLYATLTSWGLHRMGPGNAKLRDIQDLKTSVRQQANAIEVLASLTIISPQDAKLTAQKIWRVLSSLKVSIAKAQIVANSKALHHVLPALVPPIDRQYTLNFFYGRADLSIPEDEAFIEIYEGFHRLAVDHRQEIEARIGKDWHTSESKVIDNAISGYMLRKRQ